MSSEHRSDAPATQAGEPEGPQGTKLLIELGPLIVFFVTYWAFGIYSATAVLMVGTLISLVASHFILGKIGTMPIVTAVVVCSFGALTFLLNDPSFIKMKPTIVNILFGGALGVGLLMGKPLIRMMLGEQLHLQDEGWTKLTVRWMLFFFAMAGLNEFVWRTFSESTWVSFKVFGLLPLTLVFAVAQVGLIKRYQVLK